MAWKLIKTRVIGNNTYRTGSFSRRMLFIWCMLASGIFYMIPQSYSNRFQFAFAHVFRFPLSAAKNINLSNITKDRHKDTVPKKQYDDLVNRYNNLEQTLLQQRRELQRLSELNSHVGKNYEFIHGDVIPAAADSRHSELTISCRGTTGLEKGQFVLARDNSIIGRITDIFPQFGTAKVKLITDPDSKIAVQISGLAKNLQMQGNGDNTAKIGFVSKEQELKTGMEVFALRQSNFLDANMIVGTVTQFKPDDKQPLLWDITVKPSWEIEELNEVAVIVKKTQN